MGGWKEALGSEERNERPFNKKWTSRLGDFARREAGGVGGHFSFAPNLSLIHHHNTKGKGAEPPPPALEIGSRAPASKDRSSSFSPPVISRLLAMESIPRIRSSIKSTSTKQIACCCKIQPPPSGGSILEHCQVLPPTSPKLGAAAKPFFAPPFPTIFGLRKEERRKGSRCRRRPSDGWEEGKGDRTEKGIFIYPVGEEGQKRSFPPYRFSRRH